MRFLKGAMKTFERKIYDENIQKINNEIFEND